MIERKADVLADLLRASWMVDPGWSPPEIASHYQADRDWRAAVKRLRRRGIVPTVEAIRKYQRGVARVRGKILRDADPLSVLPTAANSMSMRLAQDESVSRGGALLIAPARCRFKVAGRQSILLKRPGRSE